MQASDMQLNEKAAARRELLNDATRIYLCRLHSLC